MTNYNEMVEMENEFFAQGDARRCPRHPQVKMSSDDGMYDAACCDLCEAEMEAAEEAYRLAALSPEERTAEADRARLLARLEQSQRKLASFDLGPDDIQF